jgi:vanillate O-demethylase monooxygenase subunit
VIDAALRQYWYPVAKTSDLEEQPIGIRLLDERVVLYRAAAGVTAFKDLCVHRGAPLSLGWVDGDALVCAYHGWAYAPDGACIRIPSIEPSRAIPRKARAVAYRAEERYGLIWVCLSEPRTPIPALGEVEDPAYRTIRLGPQCWETSAARMTENFFDVAHFAWLHAGLLGRRDRPRIPPLVVQRQHGEIHFEAELPVPDEAVYQGGVNRYRFRVVPPFVTQFWRVLPDGQRAVTTGVVAPVSAKQARRYVFLSRNFALDRPDEDFVNYATTVMEQDRRVVEQQRPEELPLDLSEELHIRGPDAAQIEYRRMLAELGVRD